MRQMKTIPPANISLFLFVRKHQGHTKEFRGGLRVISPLHLQNPKLWVCLPSDGEKSLRNGSAAPRLSWQAEKGQ